MTEQISFEQLPNLVSILHGEIKEVKNLLKQKNEPQQDESLPLSIKEASKLTKLSVVTLYSYCQQKTIPHHKKGNRLYFFKSEIIDWIKSGQKKTIYQIEDEVDNFLSSKRK